MELENMKKRKYLFEDCDQKINSESLVQKFIRLYNAMSDMKDILISNSIKISPLEVKHGLSLSLVFESPFDKVPKEIIRNIIERVPSSTKTLLVNKEWHSLNKDIAQQRYIEAEHEMEEAKTEAKKMEFGTSFMRRAHFELLCLDIFKRGSI